MTGIAHPVFFDENGRRARIVNVTLVLVSCMCALLLVSVVYALLVTSTLPRLDVLPPAATAPAEIARANQTSLENRASSAQPVSLVANRQVSPATAHTLRLAFYADTPGAFPSLKLHARELDAIIPRWLSVTSENGEAKVRTLDKVSSDRVVRWLRWNAPTLAVYPELSSEFNEFRHFGASRIAHEPLTNHRRNFKLPGRKRPSRGDRPIGRSYSIS